MIGLWVSQSADDVVKQLRNAQLRELIHAANAELAKRSALKPSMGEIALLNTGDKLTAIKNLRQRTGMGLLAAKNAIEDWCEANGRDYAGKEIV